MNNLLAMGKQLSSFAVVGAVGTLAHYVCLLGLVELFGIDALAASMLGAVVGALVNYFLNYRFTFQSTRRHREAMPRFLLVAGVGFALNAFFMWVALEMVGLHYLVSQVGATMLVLLWNYLGNRGWTFGGRR